MYSQEDMISLRSAFITKLNNGKHWIFKDDQQSIHMLGEVMPTKSVGSKAILEALFHNETLQMNLNDNLIRPLIDILGETKLENYTWKLFIPVKITKVAWVALNVICSKSGVTISIYDPFNATKPYYTGIIKERFLKLYPQATIDCTVYASTNPLLKIENNVGYSGYLIFESIARMFQGYKINPSFAGLTADIMTKIVAMQKTLKYTPDNIKLTFIIGDTNNHEDDGLMDNNYLVYSGDTADLIPHGNGTLFFCNSVLKTRVPIITGYFDSGKIPEKNDVNSYHSNFRAVITKNYDQYKVSLCDLFNYFNKTHKSFNQDISLLKNLGFNVPEGGYAEMTEKYFFSDAEQEEIDELAYANAKNLQRIKARKRM